MATQAAAVFIQSSATLLHRGAHHVRTSQSRQFHSTVAISVSVPTPHQSTGRTEDRTVLARSVL
jgi:hypothetical protein